MTKKEMELKIKTLEEGLDAYGRKWEDMVDALAAKFESMDTEMIRTDKRLDELEKKPKLIL